MIERFLDAGHHVGWVTGDEVYGGNPKLRAALEERGIGYVLAVACSAELPTSAGKFRADALANKVPKRAWQKLSAGRGAKGQRFYDWAVIDLTETAPGRHQLLIRRNRTTGELAYYRCHSTTPTSLATLVEVAGSRWRVEETFQTEKGLAGLDEHQVRRYPSWARWVNLAMLAHAFLAVVRADEHTPTHAGRPDPAVLQRDLPPVHHARRPACPRRGPPACLVRLAPPPPGTITHQSLPAASRIPDMKITVYSWSSSRLTATPTATEAHSAALPCTPADRPEFADQ